MELDRLLILTLLEALRLVPRFSNSSKRDVDSPPTAITAMSGFGDGGRVVVEGWLWRRSLHREEVPVTHKAFSLLTSRA
jgi:hypothetical protein